jgi:hypothetical protein
MTPSPSRQTLGKRPGKQIREGLEFRGSKRIRDPETSGSAVRLWLEAVGYDSFVTLPMPKVAARLLRHASCCFPHASPVSQTRAGKQKTAPKDRSKPLISLRKFGAGEGIRTLDPNLGKTVESSKKTRSQHGFLSPPSLGWSFCPTWSCRLLIGARRRSHDRVQIGLLEYGIPRDHPHRRPSGDLAQRAKISAAFQKPNSEMVSPVMDAESLDPSFSAGGAVRRCERIAAGLTCISVGFSELVEEHRPSIRPALFDPDRGQCGTDDRPHPNSSGFSRFCPRSTTSPVVFDCQRASIPIHMPPIEPQSFLGSQAGLAKRHHYWCRPLAVSGQQAAFLLRCQIGNALDLGTTNGKQSRRSDAIFMRAISQSRQQCRTPTSYG